MTSHSPVLQRNFEIQKDFANLELIFIFGTLPFERCPTIEENFDLERITEVDWTKYERKIALEIHKRLDRGTPQGPVVPTVVFIGILPPPVCEYFACQGACTDF